MMFARTAPLGATCVVLLLSCGGRDSPSAPTPSAPPSRPAPPAAYTCPLGKGSLQTDCSRRTPTELLSHVEAAVDLVVQRPAGILDLTQENPPRGSGQYRIVDAKAFVDAVVANLRAAGLCAEPDYDLPLESIRVKSSNEFSEDFVLVQWGEWVRRGSSVYLHNCRPAAFPVDPDPAGPPPGSGCGPPYPEPIHHFQVNVHQKGREYYILDSTPVVGPDVVYCAVIGFTDGRSYCPVRPEGNPEREACEAWRVGKAKDTGRPGPTWRYGGASGELCAGLAVNGCENHPTNQFGLYAARAGTYSACGENGACGEVYVER